MMFHVWAGGAAPELYAAYTIVKELGLSWRMVLGYELSAAEIDLLVECVNVARSRDEVAK